MEKMYEHTKVKAMCIVIRDGKEVLATSGYDPVKKENFGRLIGGHVEFGEKAEVALRRELKEELDTDIENLIFLDVIENVFVYNGNQGHEVIFLYKGDLTDKSLYKKEEMPILDSPKVIASWMPINDIKSGKLKVYPEFDYQ